MSLINNNKIIIDAPDSGVIAGAGGTIKHTNSFIIGEVPLSKADDTLYINNLESTGDLIVGGVISGDGSGLTNLPTITNAISAEALNTIYPAVSAIASTYALSATNGYTATIASVASLAATSVVNGSIGNTIAPINNPSFTGSGGSLGPMTKVLSLKDFVTIVNSPATGSININTITQANVFYTAEATSNWTLNIRGNVSVALNSLLNVGDSISVNFRATQGSVAFYMTGISIDGVSQTIKWLSKVPIAAGHPSGVDLYTFTILKTDYNTWDVMGSMINFG